MLIIRYNISELRSENVDMYCGNYGSPVHGHLDAVITAVRRLDFPKLFCSRLSHQRDLAIAMVAARILEPKSKLATTLWWTDMTLPEKSDVGDADEGALYEKWCLL